MDDLLTKAQVVNWLLDPTTKKIRRRIEQIVQFKFTEWLDGNLADSADYERGVIRGMLDVFEIEPDEEPK